MTHAVALKTIALIVEKKELGIFERNIHTSGEPYTEHDGTGGRLSNGDISHYEHERAE